MDSSPEALSDNELQLHMAKLSIEDKEEDDANSRHSLEQLPPVPTEPIATPPQRARDNRTTEKRSSSLVLAT